MLNHCTRFHSHRPLAVIRVTGEDAGAFLQGQFTNDLQQKEGSVVYGLWLNQKGRVVADSHVLRLAEKEYILVSGTSTVAVIGKRLEDYIIADDVVLKDETERFSGLSLWGAECGDRLIALIGVAPAKGRFFIGGDCVVFAGRSISEENYEIVGPEEKVARLATRLREMNCVEAGAEEAAWERLIRGIPSVPQDIGPGDLPNEGGLEQTAISYTKGCYLGQEVMARLKNLGQVRRKLHLVRGRGVPPRPLDAVFQQGRKVGEIRSVAAQGDEFAALAMLSLLGLNSESGLSLGSDESVTLRICPYE